MRIWDKLVEEVTVSGGWDGFEDDVRDIMADMDAEKILEMSMEELVERVEKEM